jgi:hypothetical protein
LPPRPSQPDGWQRCMEVNGEISESFALSK